MKVALIGATGFVGKAVLNELLHKGHQVTAIVRNPESLKPQHGLTIVNGDATDVSVLADALKGQEAVISTFNAGWANPNLYLDFLNGSKAIQEGVKKSGVKRLLVVGGAGSLFIDGKQLVDAPAFPAEYKAGATAARDYLNELKKESGLDWVFLSPAVEMHPGTSGVRKGTYRTGTENPVFDEAGRSVISVEDLAVAIVDEIEQPKFSRQRFTAAY
ncbi:MAG: NAD(P)-dependent oxidoreductase [Mucilaginibacter sp.]|uniref:NAD(P)-dependent oxidoreductase n=1 Tax=Mucilaginibacter sp. TaxID=1882438 RepID=UPI0034E434D8